MPAKWTFAQRKAYSVEHLQRTIKHRLCQPHLAHNRPERTQMLRDCPTAERSYVDISPL